MARITQAPCHRLTEVIPAFFAANAFVGATGEASIGVAADSHPARRQLKTEQPRRSSLQKWRCASHLLRRARGRTQPFRETRHEPPARRVSSHEVTPSTFLLLNSFLPYRPHGLQVPLVEPRHLMPLAYRLQSHSCGFCQGRPIWPRRLWGLVSCMGVFHSKPRPLLRRAALHRETPHDRWLPIHCSCARHTQHS